MTPIDLKLEFLVGKNKTFNAIMSSLQADIKLDQNITVGSRIKGYGFNVLVLNN